MVMKRASSSIDYEGMLDVKDKKRMGNGKRRREDTAALKRKTVLMEQEFGAGDL